MDSFKYRTKRGNPENQNYRVECNCNNSDYSKRIIYLLYIRQSFEGIFSSFRAENQKCDLKVKL